MSDTLDEYQRRIDGWQAGTWIYTARMAYDLLDLAREQECTIAKLEQAMKGVREALKCTKIAPYAYDADHSCATCGSSLAYAKDLIDEVIRP